jgi:hypothetical protein
VKRSPRGTKRSGATRAAAAAVRTASPRAAGKARKQPAARNKRAPVQAAAVTAEELRVLQAELERRMRKAPAQGHAGRPARRTKASSAAMRWNPDPEDVQKSVAQLVLTIVEFLRRLMERQAIRRMEAQTLTEEEVEAVGAALMRLEETVRDIGARFGLAPEDLNLDLGPIKMM